MIQQCDINKCEDNKCECDICAICLDNLENIDYYYLVLKCNHSFHYNCILLIIENNYGRCPLCRESFYDNTNRFMVDTYSCIGNNQTNIDIYPIIFKKLYYENNLEKSYKKMLMLFIIFFLRNYWMLLIQFMLVEPD